MKPFRALMFCTGLMAGAAFAQTPAAAPAPAKPPEKAAEKPTPGVPKHSCVRPDAPNQFNTDEQQKAFVKLMDGYRDCLMAYRNEMNKVAQAHIDAANGAIEEFNSFVRTINNK